MDLRIKGKVVLVTGSSRGIGKGCALAFAEEGAKVIISSRNSETGEAVAKEIQKKGGEAIFVQCDVSKPSSIAALFDAAIKKFGRIDTLVNNAGIAGPVVPFEEYPDKDYAELVQTNLTSVYHSMKTGIQIMKKQGGGNIINMSSIAGVAGTPLATVYSMTKHGIAGLTKSAALEVGSSNIRINALCPVFIETDMADEFLVNLQEFKASYPKTTPMGRFGKVKDVVGWVLLLSSEEWSSFMTGQLIEISGGRALGA